MTSGGFSEALMFGFNLLEKPKDRRIVLSQAASEAATSPLSLLEIALYGPEADAANHHEIVAGTTAAPL